MRIKCDQLLLTFLITAALNSIHICCLSHDQTTSMNKTAIYTLGHRNIYSTKLWQQEGLDGHHRLPINTFKVA